MAAYLVLNCIVVAITGLCLHKQLPRPDKVRLCMLCTLLVLTALFDSLMIQAGLFSYASDKILGIHIGRAPIEDFFYPLVAVMLIPPVWHMFGGDDVDKL